MNPTYRWYSSIQPFSNGYSYGHVLRLSVIMHDGVKCGCRGEITKEALKNSNAIRRLKIDMMLQTALLISDKYERRDQHEGQNRSSNKDWTRF